jgi:acylphosphatase
MPLTDIRSVLVRISGRVQGVGYRAWTAEEAQRRHLSGWVRNLATGEVEALFSGPADVVDAMLAACRRGPRLARVDNVSVSPAEPASGEFSVKYGR